MRYHGFSDVFDRSCVHCITEKVGGLSLDGPTQHFCIFMPTRKAWIRVDSSKQKDDAQTNDQDVRYERLDAYPSESKHESNRESMSYFK